MRRLLLFGLVVAPAAWAAVRSVGAATTVAALGASGARVGFAERGAYGMCDRVSLWNKSTRTCPLSARSPALFGYGSRA